MARRGGSGRRAGQDARNHVGGPVFLVAQQRLAERKSMDVFSG
jgi:hypothetical protein